MGVLIGVWLIWIDRCLSEGSELPSSATNAERIIVGWMCINVACNTFFVTEECQYLEIKQNTKIWVKGCGWIK